MEIVILVLEFITAIIWLLAGGLWLWRERRSFRGDVGVDQRRGGGSYRLGIAPDLLLVLGLVLAALLVALSVAAVALQPRSAVGSMPTESSLEPLVSAIDKLANAVGQGDDPVVESRGFGIPGLALLGLLAAITGVALFLFSATKESDPRAQRRIRNWAATLSIAGVSLMSFERVTIFRLDKIAEEATFRFGANLKPPSRQVEARLDRLPLTIRFDSGSDVPLALAGLKDHLRRVACPVVDRGTPLFVVGSVDRVRLTTEGLRRFGSNYGLAQARGERVAALIDAQCGEPRSDMMVLSRGGSNFEDSVAGGDPRERAVEVYGLSITP